MIRLAASFPDRSILWIDPESGEPMGVAIEVGFNPVTLDADFLAAGGFRTGLLFYLCGFIRWRCLRRL